MTTKKFVFVFNIKRFKYVEFYVGNAKQVVHFYKSTFGFSEYAYCGPETGVYDHVSYVLKNRKIFEDLGVV